jgi:hypothetical protein
LHEHADDCGDNILTHQDWEILEQTCSFLQAFKSCTLNVESDQASLNRSLYTLDAILGIFEDKKVRFQPLHPHC